MDVSNNPFTLALSYPQWQGSGRNENLRRGAETAANICARYAPLVRVDMAGEGTSVAGINRWTSIMAQFHSARAILSEVRPERLLTAGGDCAIDVAVIDYLLQIHADLTVVWIDAHLDANTAQTTPSGSFHGMPVSALMGHAPDEMQPYLSRPLPAAQFRYVSAHVGDEGEWAFQKLNGLRWLEDHSDISGPVHIHFDLDVFDPLEFPYLAYTDGTLKVEAGIEWVRQIAQSCDIIGLTITEFAPANDEDAQKGVGVIARICEAAGAKPISVPTCR